MKHISILLLGLLLLATACTAGDPVKFTYEGEVAGIMCIHCTNKVEAALGRLKGVVNVKVTRSESGGLPRLQIIATTARLTREDAVKALGKDSKMYDIRTLRLVRSS